MNKLKKISICWCILFCASNLHAMDEFGFINPKLVMDNQDKIRLTDKQKAALVKKVSEAQPKLMQLQLKQGDVKAKLKASIKKHPVDKKSTLAILSELIAIEKDLKTAHFSILIEVKNILTPKQVKKIKAIK